MYTCGVILCICPYVHHSVANLGRLTYDAEHSLISDVEVMHGPISDVHCLISDVDVVHCMISVVCVVVVFTDWTEVDGCGCCVVH